MYNPYDDAGGPGEYKQIRVEYKRNRTGGKKFSSGTINAGGAIIIIIFVILCLTIFGILSFMTSFADKKLADKNLANIEQYYGADSEAEKKLAEIYNAVLSAPDINNTDGVKSLLKDIDANIDVSAPDSGTGITVAYVTSMNDIQAISSKVEFYYETDKTGKNILLYKISEWKTVLTDEFGKFQYDDKSINLEDPFGR